MAISIEYSLFADNAIIEHGTRKTSLIGIFSSVYADKFPMIPTMTMFCLLKGEPGTHELKVEVFSISDAEETSLGAVPVTVSMKGPGKGTVNINFVGLPIVGKKLQFRIYEASAVIHTAVIPIIKKEGGADDSDSNTEPADGI